MATQLQAAQLAVESFKSYASHVPDTDLEQIKNEFNKDSITSAENVLNLLLEKYKSHHLTVLSGGLQTLGASYPNDWQDFVINHIDVAKIRAMIDSPTLHAISNIFSRI